jgi:hypothetical protein
MTFGRPACGNAHTYMLKVVADHGFHLDPAPMPLNVMDPHFRSFGQVVLAELVEQQNPRPRALSWNPRKVTRRQSGFSVTISICYCFQSAMPAILERERIRTA